ncbi:hypothetical protein GWK47_015357 [Chionoecetes opilio]|uniref:Uncharacterized protein n=1 Tax=Chionoecetes opilio TaxID=41210 RepID=A0A8J4XXB7_CHIOP|nr:hypothetical protein GWK47_015357 [Chionoecetes opilio]
MKDTRLQRCCSRRGRGSTTGRHTTFLTLPLRASKQTLHDGSGYGSHVYQGVVGRNLRGSGDGVGHREGRGGRAYLLGSHDMHVEGRAVWAVDEVGGACGLVNGARRAHNQQQHHIG